MDQIKHKLDSILPDVARPGRYTGNEVHVIRKEWQSVEVHFALAFPDVYEIGMSNLGTEILYHILNRQDWIATERVYSPWIDMEQRMREIGLPLFSLESKKPIRFFDVLGISLQYELLYTNVLNLLDLSGIPLRSEERKDRDPIVIAGGPCAFNPEPLAYFLDAIVLGDGEEIVIEIAEVVRKSKRERRNRKETIKALSQLDGVYIPSCYQEKFDSNGSFQGLIPKEDNVHSKVRARILDNLTLTNYPSHPLVPLIEVIHDRFSMEIMRGCTQGCRFCNAGITYRPVRERSVEDLIKQAKTVIQNTGYDEISLLSLSTSDYDNLSRLLHVLKTTLYGKEVSISFPSLRADSFTSEMIDLVNGLRRTGLTFAPEAGTTRLRNVINKGVQDKDLLQAVKIGFEHGWTRIKLYFMIGLPSETLEDIQGIVEIVYRIVQLSRKYGRKEIVVSVSPFSPKSHTPFQWESQDDLETMNEKISILKEKLKWPEVVFSWRDPKISRIETALGRGDRKVGNVIYRAWKEGARFDAWSDQFCFDRWMKAFEDSQISIHDYIESKNIEDPLPWDHLDKGVLKSYFIQEKEKALSEVVTEDCRSTQCTMCGLMTHPVCRDLSSPKKNIERSILYESKGSTFGRKVQSIRNHETKMRLRLGYRKSEEIRFTSHLDLVRIFTRALRRANVPIAYSYGYHRHPKMGTCPPLPLGFTSQAEYVDLEITDHVTRDFKKKINCCLPSGLEIFDSRIFLRKISSLNSSISLASYCINWNQPTDKEDIRGCVDAFMRKNSHLVKVNRKDIIKELDFRDFIVNMSQRNGGIEMVIRFSPQGTPKLNEIMKAVFPNSGDSLTDIKVERTGLYIEKKGKWLSPLDIE